MSSSVWSGTEIKYNHKYLTKLQPDHKVAYLSHACNYNRIFSKIDFQLIAITEVQRHIHSARHNIQLFPQGCS